ncbi:MAG TPA: glycoside hydrolase family 25 protein [Flavitalea sp.]|nr:glycoside hydrolase family 25 protein [Flavitalea sp.]
MAKKQSNYSWKIFTGIMTAAILIMGGIRLYEWYGEQRSSFVRYDAFGIELPSEYEIHGIDVSKYQQVINWDLVKQMNVDGISIGFAFIKATEGNVNQDRYFKRNWSKAREAGVARGGYHFFLATKSGRTQAENFIRTVDLEKGDLPPVLDVEQTYGVNNTTLRARVKEWLDIVEAHYGVKPIIYTNVEFYRAHLQDEFDGYPLWVAHYLQPRKPRIYRDWHFWQHSESGRVNGIASRVDFNVFYGDSTDFKNLLISE